MASGKWITTAPWICEGSRKLLSRVLTSSYIASLMLREGLRQRGVGSRLLAYAALKRRSSTLAPAARYFARSALLRASLRQRGI
jgi:hypothetical protein